MLRLRRRVPAYAERQRTAGSAPARPAREDRGDDRRRAERRRRVWRIAPRQAALAGQPGALRGARRDRLPVVAARLGAHVLCAESAAPEARPDSDALDDALQGMGRVEPVGYLVPVADAGPNRDRARPRRGDEVGVHRLPWNRIPSLPPVRLECVASRRMTCAPAPTYLRRCSRRAPQMPFTSSISARRSGGW